MKIYWPFLTHFTDLLVSNSLILFNPNEEDRMEMLVELVFDWQPIVHTILDQYQLGQLFNHPGRLYPPLAFFRPLSG